MIQPAAMEGIAASMGESSNWDSFIHPMVAMIVYWRLSI
jgi:hypothetical protein